MHEREKTAPGTGGETAPAREGTMQGVGTAGALAPASPIVSVAPNREKTVLGVGGLSPTTSEIRPIARERSVQEPPEEGWDATATAPTQEAPARPAAAAAIAAEKSIAVDLVVKKADAPKEKPDAAKARREASAPTVEIAETSIAETSVAEKSAAEKSVAEKSRETPAPEAAPRARRRWPLVLLLLVAAAVAGSYVFRDRLPWARAAWARVHALVAPH